MAEGESTLWPLTWKWAVVSVVVVVIIFYWLVLFQSSGWRLQVFQQLIVGQWRILLLWLAVYLTVGLSSLYLIYLVTRITRTRPELLFGVLVAIGILLLIAAQKGNSYSQFMYDWIDERWHIGMLSVSITALSLALAFGAIVISVRRTRR